MKLKIFQKGFNYSQDGRGNRLILHLQGCNMKCPWCSNPEGMPVNGVLFTEKEWLKETCCPMGAVKEQTLDRTKCASCEKRPCIRGNRQKGIRLSFKEYEIETLVEECIAARPMFFDGGGVTLTGGEITLQFEAVKAFLTALGEAGIHRAIESNGTHPRMEELLPLVDEWIMDLKHYDDTKHREWLGVSNVHVIKNLEKAAKLHPDVLVRIPLIPGFNDSQEDAEAFGALLKQTIGGTAAKAEFLTYHEFGKGKWEQCGMEYTMKPGRIAPETVPYFEKVLGNHGISCVRT